MVLAVQGLIPEQLESVVTEKTPSRLLIMLLIGAILLTAIMALVPENGKESINAPNPGAITASKSQLSTP